MVPFSTVKSQLLDTATKDALLFEDDRFSSNQNNLAYLVTCDPSVDIKDEGKTLYLGTHGENLQIIANLNSTLTIDNFKKLYPEDSATWELVWTDPAMEAKYATYFDLNSVTGVLTINRPEIELPEDTKLELVPFKAKASTDKMSAITTTLFFFNANPAYRETLDQADVTLALTDTNSISFYATWFTEIK
jgi:hypothetical protein